VGSVPAHCSFSWRAYGGFRFLIMLVALGLGPLTVAVGYY